MNVRRIALHALMDITDKGAYANLRLKSLPDTLTAEERKRICALVYTALDHQIYIDWLLTHYVSGRQKPVIRAILRLSVTELLYFHTPAHAVVSEYVALTRDVGKAAMTGFVNGVLRSVDRARDALPPLPDDPVDRLSIQFSYPKWIVSEWVHAYGAQFTQSLLCAPAIGTSVRAQYPSTTEELAAVLPVPVTPGAYDPNCLLLKEGVDVTALACYRDGGMTVQGQSAMLCCRALGDCTGKTVLDACAAPGGKSAYLSSLCHNDVSITAMELHPHRLELMNKTFARLHVPARTLCQDATHSVDAFLGAFDAVLLDAPCSGLGMLNEKPDIRYAKSNEDIVALSELQRTLLETCANYVAQNGVLLYATCTISKRENEENVRAFLSNHPEFELESMPLPIPNDGMLQLFPHVHGTDGFFMARLRKCI